MAEPSVAIILVNWNTFDFSKSCIEQLHELSYHNFKIILVDNGSTDGSGEILNSLFPEITYIRNQNNLGFTGGNNSGIEHALKENFDLILLLNNDTYFEKDFLSPLVKFLEKNQSVGAAQPLIFENGNRDKVWHAGGEFSLLKGSSKSIKTKNNTNSPYPSKWLTGCAFMIRSSVVREIGSLKETYFAYFEDVDWSFRVRKAGLALYIVPESVIYHEVSGSTKSKKRGKEGFLSPLAHYLNIRNQLLLLKCHPDRIFIPSAWTFQILKISVYLIYFVLRLRFKKFKAAFAGLKAGLSDDPNSEKLPSIQCYL